MNKQSKPQRYKNPKLQTRPHAKPKTELKPNNGQSRTTRRSTAVTAMLIAIALMGALLLMGCGGSKSTANMTPEQKAAEYAKPYKPKSIMIEPLNDTIATVETHWKDGQMYYTLDIDRSNELTQWLNEHPKGRFVVTWEKDGRVVAGFDAPFQNFAQVGKDYIFEGNSDCGLDVYDDVYANRDYWGLTWNLEGEAGQQGQAQTEQPQ